MDSSAQKTKTIVYKGKEKTIPVCNPDKTKCEHYVISKFRYCHFDKYKDSMYCIYHTQDNQDDFAICPYDPKHRILKSKLNQHIKTCNTYALLKQRESNPWYARNINHAKDIKNLLPPENHLKSLYEQKWENLEEGEFNSIVNKILSVYEKIKQMFIKYAEENKLKEFIEEKFPNENYVLSGIVFDEKDLNSTAQMIHSTKHAMQNKSLGNVIVKSGLLESESSLVIEFGAGKGGLSEEVNKAAKPGTMINILLERQGMRYKKEKQNTTMIRYRTDIIDFNINYLNTITNVTKDENIIQSFDSHYSIVGIAKHICGCAFDLSLTCLFNYAEFDKVKGICMATCCHHICRVELLNHLDFYIEELGMTVKEIVFLFKASSWIFGAVKNKAKEEKIFKEKKITKNYIGLLSKYIIDLARCFCLVRKGFKVVYLKYCGNEVTTENNLILAIKK